MSNALWLFVQLVWVGIRRRAIRQFLDNEGNDAEDPGILVSGRGFHDDLPLEHRSCSVPPAHLAVAGQHLSCLVNGIQARRVATEIWLSTR